MQNMLLMAHALGVGAVWLTFNSQAMKDRLREFFHLPDHIAILNYIALGYAALHPIPRGRHAIQEVIIGRV
jgi:nitroreductase